MDLPYLRMRKEGPTIHTVKDTSALSDQRLATSTSDGQPYLQKKLTTSTATTTGKYGRMQVADTSSAKRLSPPHDSNGPTQPSTPPLSAGVPALPTIPVPAALVERLKPHLTCTICTGVLSSAMVLSCGHSFCAYCLFKWLTENPTCPRCPVGLRSLPSRCTAIDAVVELLVPSLPPQEQDHYASRKSESATACSKVTKLFWHISGGSSNPLSQPQASGLGLASGPNLLLGGMASPQHLQQRASHQHLQRQQRQQQQQQQQQMMGSSRPTSQSPLLQMHQRLGSAPTGGVGSPASFQPSAALHSLGMLPGMPLAQSPQAGSHSLYPGMQQLMQQPAQQLSQSFSRMQVGGHGQGQQQYDSSASSMGLQQSDVGSWMGQQGLLPPELMYGVGSGQGSAGSYYGVAGHLM